MRYVVLVMTAALIGGQALASGRVTREQLEQYDKATLVELADRLYDRVAMLEQKLADIEDGSRPMEVAQGEWTVRILAVEEVDVAAIDAKIQRERDALPALRKKLAAARDVLRKREEAKTSSKTEDGKMKERAKYSRRELAPYKRDVSQLDRQLKLSRVRITKLEQQRRAMERERILTGELVDDGKAARLIARGAYVGLADVIEVGQVYRVTGRGRIGDLAEVQVRSVQRIDE